MPINKEILLKLYANDASLTDLNLSYCKLTEENLDELLRALEKIRISLR